MTVSTIASRAEYTGNGSTVAFAVVDTGGASAVIPVLDATHLQVYVDGTLKTKDTHYTVSIVTATAAATVTFITSPTDYTPASSTSIVILRVIPYTQLQDYVNNDAFDAENVESALDQLTQALHQIVDDKDRSIKFSSTIASSDFNTDEETASKITSVKADRASKYLGFDADGDITTSTTVEGASYTETSIAAGDILVYNGSAFVNTKLLARITQILDSSGNEVIKFGTTGSAVNEITVTNAATGNPPTISATGEADKGIDFENSEGEELLKLASVSSAVNEITVKNAATGNNPTIQATGEADTGVDFENSEGEEILILDATATAVNEITVANAATGNAPTLSATGDDTNIDITLTPKGTGEVNISKVDIDGGTINGITDLAVADGGTGASTHTANNVLVGAGASAITSIAPGADGQVLTSTGTVWQSEAVPALAATGLTTDGTDITITSGNFIIGAADKGIDFTAAQTSTTATNATTTNEVLTSYEEGTWTATLPNGGSINTNSAFYTKVGRVVFWFWTGTLTITDNSNQFRIGGLPFTVKTDNYSGGTIGYVGSAGVEGWGMMLNHGPSTDQIYFHRQDSTSDIVLNSLVDGVITALSISGTYIV